mmetsp:Transcript_38445/g.108645  ORF Transcript_38445/g.108645 Transcript_38445/m.108645 type:complete len:229 (+) Transcript_38445:1792-2478(+)
MVVFPWKAAKRSGVFPSLSVRVESAPALRNLSTISGNPCHTAQCRGVLPSAAGRLTSMEGVASSMSMVCRSSTKTARWSDVQRLKSPALTSACSRSSFTASLYLWETASCRAVLPSLLRFSQGGLNGAKDRIHAAELFRAASCRGVLPSTSTADMLAPLVTSSLTSKECPAQQARWRGVLRLLSRRVSFAPLQIRSPAMWRWPCQAARWSGVSLNCVTAWMFEPLALR